MKVCSLSIVASIVATYTFAQQPIENIAESELSSLLVVYKDIHRHPELSAHEERTSAIIAKELPAAGCEVTDHFGKYPALPFTRYPEQVVSSSPCTSRTRHQIPRASSSPHPGSETRRESQT